MLRDLFNRDNGGWLQDAALLDRLAREKLERAAEEIRAEGWKWSEIAIDFPYGHTTGLRRLPGTQAPVTEEEQVRYDAAVAEYNRLSEENESADEIPEDADQRMAELEAEIASIVERPSIYDRAEIARAGVFVSIDHDGRLKVERDSSAPRTKLARRVALWPRRGSRDPAPIGRRRHHGGRRHGDGPRLVGADRGRGRDLAKTLWSHGRRAIGSSHRGDALGLASDPQAAFIAATHALALNSFYSANSHSCLDLSERSVTLGSHAPGIGDSLAARTLFESFGNWQMRLPADPVNLWSWLLAQDESVRAELFALCVGLSVNALNMPWERRTSVLQHADQLAEHIALDMRVYWSASVKSFLGKVTKAHILAAVREAKGNETAEMIAHLKKADMAVEAERLLQGTGWLPEGLRTPHLESLLRSRNWARPRAILQTCRTKRSRPFSKSQLKVLTIPPPPNSPLATNHSHHQERARLRRRALFLSGGRHVRLVSTLRL